ncbi:hypothetical protein F5878DRAFT_711710 [Lentinula raphanica]|uniref:Uncharacterized protein n=1 Tax=Lentinula raphanica TaxID=153919 RepID=A0AA38P4P8_9AGAR|nr:hypothetical protein F5880DRAFT_351946 [Lentinula raphanica]KAJ3836023.1 hypothetical protein F5878DRAFT_711710 [Lentinula raphanica]
MPKCSSAPRIGLLFLLFLIVNVVLAAPVSTDAPVGTDNWIRVLIIRSKTSHQGKSDPDRLVPKDEGIGSDETILLCFERIKCVQLYRPNEKLISLPWASSYNGYDAIHIASVETTEEEANEVISKMIIAKPTPPNQYESLTEMMSVVFGNFRNGLTLKMAMIASSKATESPAWNQFITSVLRAGV